MKMRLSRIAFRKKEYTLDEIKDSLNKNYDNSVGTVEYAYIDCGADGVKEMALRIQGTFVEPDSSMTYVIKEMGYTEIQKPAKSPMSTKI